MPYNATENQRMRRGCPVQGNHRTGCSTDSIGSGSGSTAATAGRTGREKQGTTNKSMTTKP